MGTGIQGIYMERCFQLAQLGAGHVAPNPMVGAILVHEDAIIGEGYHQRYGEAHAEVHCINNALRLHPELIAKATLYVSLEPCAHYGKTPPCADLIIRHKIPRVVIGCRDSFEAVNGKGIEKLRNAGVEVIEQIADGKAIALNKRFFTFHGLKRPYIILKWAQTRDGIMASEGAERLKITNPVTDRLVHRWRSEEAAILVGAATAVKDDPLLDNRYWFGNPPLKIIVSASGKLPGELQLFHSGDPVWVFNREQAKKEAQAEWIRVEDPDLIGGMLDLLFERQVQSVFVEGGRRLLQSFIDSDLWDEARVITNTGMIAGSGLQAPRLQRQALLQTTVSGSDEIAIYKNMSNQFII
ncbi:bifunctional diaminohydroxyphosphoribosylaminopyrimidine deaminase/5-amino-6-(5-phosphoribosylamino)uracil reductase RibD [Niabella beijingensis]|uniref:bifunctional diaminohydroxyphosphoribosylaminopyrimidine deaminase/5-amino-6-(5-phosphoribosylamino)uracil reductase RibD n=1 Tax=Niabella beijingensis TaxID=2872700 RepID=UPI001CBFF001|nr:bifunctional diaminohydroxyphosphoribosylaminopyrimidine deaminase/5-amino-6-(5-phosphoribosylamino)uracil reductase RibD [Niabella beijingensis]MBZ4191140.1 bifunctional diaminohydroxyphosphoribosylaminopyrimidine deaminase/5-amino-6-(5-phosphoribosylamino)uracil reductase RibD [Niabella beijingensis]